VHGVSKRKIEEKTDEGIGSWYSESRWSSYVNRASLFSGWRLDATARIRKLYSIDLRYAASPAAAQIQLT
jgi:hypothetical protein